MKRKLNLAAKVAASGEALEAAEDPGSSRADGRLPSSQIVYRFTWRLVQC